MPTYTLGAMFVAEMLGTMFGIYFGDSVVANALLPGAKGQSMGNGWISFGFGLAFFFPGVFFGHISGRFNPAFCLADLVLGNLDGTEFVVLSIAEILGAFIGAVLVWLHWAPHFKTVPEPPAPNPSDQLLRKRDALPQNAVNIASYATKPMYNSFKNLRRRKKTTKPTNANSTEPSQGVSSGFVHSPIMKGSTFRMGAAEPAPVEGEADGVREAMADFGQGALNLARAWVSDVKYYTVQPDRYRPPDGEEQEQELLEQEQELLASRTNPEVHVSMDVESGNCGRQQSGAFGNMAGGLYRLMSRRRGPRTSDGGTSMSSMQSNKSSKKYTRDQLANVLMEEHLQLEMKQSALPGIFYTAGLAPALMAASRPEGTDFGSENANSGGGAQLQRGRPNSHGSMRRSNGSGDQRSSSLRHVGSAHPAFPRADTIHEEEEQHEQSVHSLHSGESRFAQSPPQGEVGTADEGVETDGQEEAAQGREREGGGQRGMTHVASTSSVVSMGHSSNSEAHLAGEHDDVVPELPVFDTSEREPANMATGVPVMNPTWEDSRVDDDASIMFDTPFGAGSLQTFSQGGDSESDKEGPKTLNALPSFASRRYPGGQQQQKRMGSAVPLTMAQLGTMRRGGGGDGPMKPTEVQQTVDDAAQSAFEQERARVMALYEAAVVADQNVKLSVFTTRPAVYSPPFNWLCEFMSTVTIILGVNLMAKQISLEGVPGAVALPYYIGLFICLLVLGLGGPTGLSVNPARDIGPRLAHQLLPIPNKGSSEWYYGWIPPTAAMAGGAIGAVLFMAIRLLDDEYA